MISCIVPVHNGEKYLAEALDSIFNQTIHALEVIVVDDGSTDGTADVVQRYGRDVRYLYQENAGSPSARNRGLVVARGEFLAWLDADDLWLPEKLEKQLERFAARSELEGSVTHIENFWSPELGADEKWFRDDKRPMIVAGYSPATLLVRAEAFARYGPWDASDRHASNAEWFVRALAAGAQIELMPDVLVRRRLHVTNQSRRLMQDSHDEYLRLAKAVLDRRRAQHPAG